ncbi:tyrosyl-tRNA synthetase [Fistulina hepatica ATCC 64428]|uniref:Tyrosine--tRNA ligase n=1 Tax=Fistulina hepatica ATCC 64428 TaxID=1128425 RepID=A0A0D7AFZ0_9AGAR|nr:tyrosyl-tRNA synthetase [Fistulina hepatica ATCC 64428]
MLSRHGRTLERVLRPSLLTQLRGVSSAPPLIHELVERGMVWDVSRKEELEASVQRKKHTVYAGVDPTAPALHVGHLLPLITLLHFHLRGHTVIPLIGGATGLVGDPSGRSTERDRANKTVVQQNVESLTTAVSKFFTGALRYAQSRGVATKIEDNPVAVRSNLEWHQDIRVLDFLQTVGHHARLNTMLSRDSVRTRLESKDGMSFAEFTYQLLQAYDFFYLYRNYNCTIQVGGSDQWGNIVSGLELISRTSAAEKGGLPQEPVEDCYGLTLPLITTPSGEKFGKSAGNAVWLDSRLTSVFGLYQYFMQTDDRSLRKYLNFFTLLPREEIDTIVASHEASPDKRDGQRKLAGEVTEMVHGRDASLAAEEASKILFSDISQLDISRIVRALSGDPRLVSLNEECLLGEPVIALASTHGLLSSKGEARRLADAKGLYVNNVPVGTMSTIGAEQFIDNQIVILRAGKNKFLVLRRVTS